VNIAHRDPKPESQVLAALTELAAAPAVDMRPMDLRLRVALIAADIEHELLKEDERV
jgi:hypothetical protein